ncbi:33 kDa chaperonin [Hyphomicrobiales bacterium]|nr:33 kDa chaperonin [Hyphomicrobiales bacterium]CAH1675585.1 33 kDa chaperonin [Hyphomicrobiales bacterium]
MVDVSAETADDRVLPFAVEGLDVRGRVVKLGPALDTILRRHAYPPAVARVLGEATALTALLGSALKFNGRFQLQTRTDGVIDMLVVDFDAPDRLRACARFDAERLAGLAETGTLATGDLLGNGHLALTVDQGSEMSRYQGVVALEGDDLEAAAHQYFLQSEQIPTRVRLAVGEAFTSDGEGSGMRYRAGGLMVQFLPPSTDRQRQQDLHPGDAPEGHDLGRTEAFEDDGWVEAKLLADTTEDHELIDPALQSERLLLRLFHERGVRVFEGQPVHEACRCSRPRILATLRSFSQQDRDDMIGDDGHIGITCEFCSRHYEIEPAELADEPA